MRRIGLVSDTHGLLRQEVVDGLAGVERILHLGDVGKDGILEALRAVAPVDVVRGNVDHGAWADLLPRTAAVEVFGAAAYLIHDIGQLDLDPAAAGLRFVFYGHTHAPKAEERDGVWYVNPGSIGPRRFSQPVSYAILEPDLSVRFVEIAAR